MLWHPAPPRRRRRPAQPAAVWRAAAELILEIDDQDNLPLTIERIKRRGARPRLFSLMPGDGYRLLLGDPGPARRTTTSRSLRQAVLAYACAADAARQPGVQPRLSLAPATCCAPPTARFVGLAAAGGGVLLAITIRLLDETPPPGENRAFGAIWPMRCRVGGGRRTRRPNRATGPIKRAGEVLPVRLGR